MTKKHYEAIAGILRSSNITHTRSDWQRIAVCNIANSLSDYFAQDNPRFDRDRFLKACGIEKYHYLTSCTECKNRLEGRKVNPMDGVTCPYCGTKNQ